MAGAIGALINKKALEETPKQVFNWYIFLSAFAIALSGGLHGSNTSNISGIIMPSFQKTFHWSSYSLSEKSNISGWITSVIVLGGLAGTLTSAPFNDRLGRKWTMFMNGAIYTVGCVVQITAVGNVNQIIAGRAIQGYAAGGGSVNGAMFLAEISPKAIRGLLGAFLSLNIMLGVALGYWMNYLAILHINSTSNWQWRFPVLFQMYPGILICLIVPFVVESPRWLAVKGRTEEARRNLSRLRRLPEDHPFVQAEIQDIENGVNSEASASSSTSYLGLWHELRRDITLRRRFLLVMIVQLGFNFSGGNSITYYQTSILGTIGVTNSHGAYLFSGIYGLMKVSAVFVYAFFCSERFGRRTMLLSGSICNMLCVLYIAIYLGVLAPVHNKSAGWVAVACLCIFAIGYGVGWAPVAIGLNAEVFPNRLRSKIMSITFSVQYLTNFLLTRFFPNMIAGIGTYGPFSIFASVSAVIIVYLFFAMPETKNIGMEHMDQLFSQKWFLNGVHPKHIPELHGPKEVMAYDNGDSRVLEDMEGKGDVELVETIELGKAPHPV